MSGDHGEPIRKKISTIKLQISSKTAILAVENEIILENPLKIDENFTIFRKFFEILKTSSIEKVFLINLDMNCGFEDEFHQEFSKIKTKFEVKNVIFDEKSATNVVISIINECNQLNGIFMRGFIFEKDNFHSRFFYEVKLARSETINDRRTIEKLKEIIGKYELDGETFAEFLKNFTKNSPIGTEMFMETPFEKDESKGVYMRLFSINSSGRFLWNSEEQMIPRWTGRCENRLFLKYRPFGVYCRIQDNDTIIAQNSPPRSKKRKIESGGSSFPVKQPNVKEHSIEEYLENRELLENEKQLTESKKNWNNLPVEMKLKCIQKMDDKTKTMLRSCSKSDKKVVDKEKRHFNVLMFSDLVYSYDNGFERENETTLSTIDSSEESVPLCHLKYSSNGGSEKDKEKRLSFYKYLSNLLENSEIETLKIELGKKSEWWNYYSEYGKERKKVENLEVQCLLSYNEMYEMSMKFNAKSISLDSDDYVPFDELGPIFQRIIENKWEIGRKIEISPIYDQRNVEILTNQFKMDVVSEDAKHIRWAMKEDPNKHILVLRRPNNTVELAVISKDLTEIPDSFFS